MSGGFTFKVPGTKAPTPAAPVDRQQLLAEVNALATDTDLALLVRLLKDPKKKIKALNAAVKFLKI